MGLVSENKKFNLEEKNFPSYASAIIYVRYNYPMIFAGFCEEIKNDRFKDFCYDKNGKVTYVHKEQEQYKMNRLNKFLFKHNLKFNYVPNSSIPRNVKYDNVSLSDLM